MKKVISVLLVATLLTTMLAACGGKQEAEATTSQTQAAATETEAPANVVKNDGTTEEVTEEDNLDCDITVVQALDMVSFDPIQSADMSNVYTLNCVYSKLFRYSSDLGADAELCKSYEQVSDTEWHFTIWDNVKCHDGSVLTIDDVLYCLERAKGCSIMSSLFKPVKEITKVDDTTISITTDGPYPSLPTALTNVACSIVPKSYCEKAIAEDDWSQPIGSGRYKFKERIIGDSISFERFDDYFDQEDAALNKNLTIKVIPEGTSRTIAIEAGDADFNAEFASSDYDRVVANSDLKLWQRDSQTVWHLGMDNTNENFSNPLVRKAVCCAVDKASCLAVGHEGKGSVISSCCTFAPGVIGYEEAGYDYDLEQAKKYMEEAGCTGFDTDIIVFRDEAERIATVVQACLAEIGINATITRIENAVWPTYVAEHNAPMYITSWGCYSDPDLFLSRRFSADGFGGVNRDWYESETLNELIKQGRGSFDDEERAVTYKEIQEFMKEEAPEHDLYVNTTFALSNKDLKGVVINAERADQYWKLHY